MQSSEGLAAEHTHPSWEDQPGAKMCCLCTTLMSARALPACWPYGRFSPHVKDRGRASK
jgi:hypothetical protein